MRGSKPGERRGGRPKGGRNKATKDIQEAARVYTVEALETLASVMRKSESDQARVLAADKLLDRGHGKAKQVLSGDAANPLHMLIGFKDAVRVKLARLANQASD